MANSLTAYLSSAKELSITDEAMAAALQETVSDASTGSGGGVTYLNFSGKTGRYSLGKDREDVDPNAVYLIEPKSVFRGWQCWKGNKPVAKHKWSIYNPTGAVPEEDLEDHGPYKDSEGWKEMLGFGAVSLDGEDTMIEFSTDSVSGRNAATALLDEIRERMVSRQPYIPIIHFRGEPFMAQDKQNYKPVFAVDVWVDRISSEAYFSQGVTYSVDDLRGGKSLTAAQKKKLAA